MAVRGYNASSLVLNTSGSDYLIRDFLRIALGSIIIIGNAINISVICFFKNLRSNTNAILSSLAVVDMMTGIIILILPYVPYQQREKSLCFLSYSLAYALSSNSAFHLIIVTLERYLAIIHPLHYPIYFTNRRLVLCLSTCWCLFMILLSIELILGFANSTDANAGVCTAFHLPDLFNNLQIAFGTFTTAILVLMYVRIYKEIYKQHSRIRDQHCFSMANTAAKVKLTTTLFITVGSFVLCWWPFIICVLVGQFVIKNDHVSHLLATLTRCAEILLLMNSGMNPVIYIIRMKQFRIAYLKLFQGCLCTRSSAD